jgi:oligopeptide transport system substrate-binding protein
MSSRWLAIGALVMGVAPLSCSDLPPTVRSTAPVETMDAPLVGGQRGGILHLLSAEPPAIDPSNVSDAPGYQIASYLFTGLVKIAADGTATAAVATGWESTHDCTQWTFQLRRGTRFHNGEEVTSAAFKRGWERAASAGGSPMAHLLDTVVGFAEAGATGSLPGVDASDPYRLTVSLIRPDCEFLRRMVHPVFSPVPSFAGPADNRVYDDQPIGNGPFQMDGLWQHDRGIRLVRYDDYQLGPKANLDAVETTIKINPDEEAYPRFRSGTTDWTAIPAEMRDQARSTYLPRGQYSAKRSNGTSFLRVMVTTPPLQSVTARKALSLAIDRAAILRDVFAASTTLATSLIQPSMLDGARDDVCDVCRYDPDEAKRQAIDARLIPGTVLNLVLNDDGHQERWMTFIKRNLENNLGLRVNYYSEPFRDLLVDMAAFGTSGVFRISWAAEFPSPGDVLGPLLSTSAIGTSDPTKPATGDNTGRYSNPRVDRLLDKAGATEDGIERAALYRQAEQIAIGDDLAVIPLWYQQVDLLARTDRFANLRMDWYANLDLTLVTIR